MNLNFIINDSAITELKKLLNNNPQYKYIRLSLEKACHSKYTVGITLDYEKSESSDIYVDYYGISIIYNENINKYFKDITVIFEEDTFKIKSTAINNNCSSCNCKKGCSSCPSSKNGNCSGCKNNR
ncbi:Hypothetical protein CM240_1353 [Clostridium bornimense]|uniref:FeS cluster biogenesis domain-containing protein n=1 Tax=Clostridium bornimense TaxID=1216932 RepID=W6S2I1_9CLOT|nr:hypothetical protein [Clostridium bornimense]CDM68512.1 Hypothetical protein CM240_1353 [Clostridium bornimense]